LSKAWSTCAKRSLPGGGGNFEKRRGLLYKEFVDKTQKGGTPPMASLAYRRLYEMNKVEARKELIKTYQETGSISATARLWNTSRQVVRKWVRRYQAQKEEGLKDKSRRPLHSPRQTLEEIS
jgi:DNA invertase Pin-like site-specific DNA recombinase